MPLKGIPCIAQVVESVTHSLVEKPMGPLLGKLYQKSFIRQVLFKKYGAG
jgi:hypothetical protein